MFIHIVYITQFIITKFMPGAKENIMVFRMTLESSVPDPDPFVSSSTFGLPRYGSAIFIYFI
jgi:hypothetical protein